MIRRLNAQETPMTDRTAGAHQFLLRLPKPLHRRLLAQAKRNNVSLNTEIVNQLEGRETATATQMAETIGPLVQNAVEAALENKIGAFIHELDPVTEDELMQFFGDATPNEKEIEIARRLYRRHSEQTAEFFRNKIKIGRLKEPPEEAADN